MELNKRVRVRRCERKLCITLIRACTVPLYMYTAELGVCALPSGQRQHPVWTKSGEEGKENQQSLLLSQSRWRERLLYTAVCNFTHVHVARILCVVFLIKDRIPTVQFCFGI